MYERREVEIPCRGSWTVTVKGIFRLRMTAFWALMLRSG